MFGNFWKRTTKLISLKCSTVQYKIWHQLNSDCAVMRTKM